MDQETYFDYPQFTEGVADCSDSDSYDTSYYLGIAYEVIRACPDLARLYLEATTDGEPTEGRLAEIYNMTIGAAKQ
jgi:hypothetical protein